MRGQSKYDALVYFPPATSYSASNGRSGRRRRSWPQDATNITHDNGRYHTQESWKGPLVSERK